MKNEDLFIQLQAQIFSSEKWENDFKKSESLCTNLTEELKIMTKELKEIKLAKLIFTEKETQTVVGASFFEKPKSTGI